MAQQQEREKLRQLLSLPRFNELPFETQMQELSQFDPSFQNLTPEQFETFKSGIGISPLQAGTSAENIRPRGYADTLRDFGLPGSLEESVPWLRTGATIATGLAVGIGSKGIVPLLSRFSPAAITAIRSGLASATMGMTDEALRTQTGEGTGSMLGTESHMLSALEQAILNEAGGYAMQGAIKAGGGAIRSAKEAISPGSVVGQDILAVQPTVAQALKSRAAEVIEDVFARSSKLDAIDRAASNSLKIIEENVKRLTGRTAPMRKDTLSDVITAELKQSFRRSVQASNEYAEKFLLAAEQNPLTISKASQSPITSATGAPLSATQNVTIAGPITQAKSLEELYIVRKNIVSTEVTPDPERLVMNEIDNIFRATNAKFDADGKLLSHDPIGAAEAWKQKQVLDKLAYGDPLENINVQNSKLKKVTELLTQDMEESIKLWPNISEEAVDAWLMSKAIVNKRHKLFSPMFETGKSIRTLLNTVKAPEKDISAILKDRKQVQRFLETGNMVVNGKQIVSNNAKKDLAGYHLLDTFDKSWTPLDATDFTKGHLNGPKLVADMAEYFNSPAGRQLYTAKNRADIGQLVNLVARTASGVQGTGPSTYLTLNVGIKAITLGSAILTGSYARGSFGAAVVVGGTVGLSVLGRLMTNPGTARLAIAMFSGQPLGMSTRLASRTLMQSLRGVNITLTLDNGEEVDGTINAQGQFAPAEPQ